MKRRNKRLSFSVVLALLMVPFLITVARGALAPPETPAVEFAPGEVIVKFKASASKADKVKARAAAGIETKTKLPLPDVELVKIKDKASVNSVVAKLKADPKIKYAEPNYRVSASMMPNDPNFSQLFGMHNTGQVVNGTPGVADMDIDAPEAWDFGLGSPEVVIGVIDTGLDLSHPDLVDNAWVNPGEIANDGIDNDNNGYVDDINGWDFVEEDKDVYESGDHWHATHVAGTIAAKGNNNIGVIGVAPRVKIMAAKFLDGSGSGWTADAIEAVAYTTRMNAVATNNSWGGGGFSQALKDAIDEYNGVFVAAAGNAGTNNDQQPFYPAAYSSSNLMAVAAVTNQGQRAYFSCWGPTTVDVGAPGLDVLSTYPGGGYAYASGTSMATPHVTGVVALASSLDPSLDRLELVDLVKRTAVPIPALQGKVASNGMANAFEVAKNARWVTGTSPADGALEVPVDTTITATFSLPVVPGPNFDGITLSEGSATVETTTALSGDSILTIKPLADLNINKQYTVTIPAGAVSYGDGIGMPGSYSFKFRTHDTIAPAVTLADPANGQDEIPLNKTIKLTFGENILEGAHFSDITLTDGTVERPTALSIKDDVLTIDPNHDLEYDTSYTVTVPAGAVTDLVEQGLESPYILKFKSVPDRVLPTATSNNPANNASNVITAKTITVVFSEDVTPGPAFSDISLSSGTSSIPFSGFVADNVLRIDPQANLSFNKTYNVFIPGSALVDAAENPLANNHSFSFSTPDASLPVVTSVDPSNDSSGAPLDKTIKITFSENIVQGLNWGRVKLTDGILTVPAAYSISGKDLIINPSSNLVYDRLYTIKVPAEAVQDNSGNAFTDSLASTFRAEPDGYSPVVSSTSPTNGQRQVPVNKTITVLYNETIAAGPNFPQITLKEGANTVDATATVAGKVLTIDPAGLEINKSYTVSVPEGAIEDTVGNAAASYSLNFFTPDTVLPQAMSSVPADGAVSVSRNTLPFYVYFSEDISAGPNFSDIKVEVDDEAVPLADVTAGSNYVAITPEDNPIQCDTTYTISLPAGAVVDAVGNDGTAYTFSFRTEVDVYSPDVVSTIPANGQTNASEQNDIKVTYGEPIQAGDNFSQIALKVGTATIDASVTVANRTLTIDPVAYLEKDAFHTVSIPAGAIKDAAGNASGAYSFGFTTADSIGPKVAWTDPANGAVGVALDKTISVNVGEATAKGAAFGSINLKNAAGTTINAFIDYDGWWDDDDNWYEDTSLIKIDPSANLAYDTTYTATLPFDSVRDVFGNKSEAYSFSFKTPFKVLSSNPSNGFADAAISQNVVLTLSAATTEGPDFNDIALKTGTTTVPAALSVSGQSLTINPDANLNYDTPYTLSVPRHALHDLAGSPLDSTFTTGFRTHVYKVTGTDPANSAAQVPVNKTITVTINEDSTAAANFGNITLKAGTTTVDSTITISGRTLTIDPVSSLNENSGYAVSVPAGAIADMWGAPLPAHSFSFTTIDTIAPQVSWSDPVDGSTAVPLNKMIVVKLSEATVQGSAFGSITLKNAAGTTISTWRHYDEWYDDDDNWFEDTSRILIYPYANLANDTTYTVTLPFDSVRDGGGNKNAAYSFSFKTPFKAVSSNPANNSTDGSIAKNLTVTFNGGAAEGPDFNDIALKTGTTTVPAALSVSGQTLTINPDANLNYDTPYTLSVPRHAIHDLGGSPLDSTFTAGFRTHIYKVSGTDPANGAAQVPVNKTITVTMNEDSTAAANFGNITLKAGSTVIDSTITLNNQTLTIDPVADLNENTNYTVSVPSGAITDAWGQPLGAHSFGFTTIDTVFPQVSWSDPANGATAVPLNKMIVVKLSEATVQGSAFGSITLKNAAGTTISTWRHYDEWYDDDDNWFEDTSRILISHYPNFVANTTYTVTLPFDSVRDGGGNKNAAHSFSFTTQ